MITPDQIATVCLESDSDFSTTQELIACFERVRKLRVPFHLTGPEFERVLSWKLRKQLGRQAARRSANTDDIIRCVTAAAFTVSHSDPGYDLELRTSLLCALRGVGVPVASAVLALTMPERFGVIDIRGWRQVFGEERTTFTVCDYHRYMIKIWHFAAILRITPQQVDYSIWLYDEQEGGAERRRRMGPPPP